MKRRSLCGPHSHCATSFAHYRFMHRERPGIARLCRSRRGSPRRERKRIIRAGGGCPCRRCSGQRPDKNEPPYSCRSVQRIGHRAVSHGARRTRLSIRFARRLRREAFKRRSDDLANGRYKRGRPAGCHAGFGIVEGYRMGQRREHRCTTHGPVHDLLRSRMDHHSG